MLRLPTSVGEWGFVVVLSVLFAGIAFAIIYSQVELRDMRKQQARSDTEAHLRFLAEKVRRYHEEHGEIEPMLTEMGVKEEALETRHADFDNEVETDGTNFLLHATRSDYSICTLSFDIGSETVSISWDTE